MAVVSVCLCGIKMSSKPCSPAQALTEPSQTDLLSHILETAPVLVAVLDQQLRYQYVSRRYAEFLGRPIAAILGAHAQEVLPAEAYQAAQGHLQRALAGQGQIYDLLLPAQGELDERIVRVHYQPRLGPDGSQQGITMFGIEITSLKKSEEERLRADTLVRLVAAQNEEMKRVNAKLLASQAEAAAHAASALEAQSRLREAAERRNEEKGKFLAAAVHDLRQPLQTLASATSPLLRQIETGDTALALASARLIRSASNLLNQQLNGMLEITQLELGQLRPCVADFPLQELLDDLRLQFEKPCEALELSLHIEGPPAKAGVRLTSDFHLLFRVLSNLVSNSIKYRNLNEGAPCFVRIACRYAAGRLEILVEDNGIGIPAGDLAEGRVFKPFYQAHPTHPGSRNGVGLGLSIVNAIVRLLPEHELSIESIVKQGTRVHLRLPAKTSQEEGQEGTRRQEAQAEPMASVEGMRILLVDDNALLLASMKLMLESFGAEVWASQSLEEVREVLDARAQPPDVLVTDLRLQGGRSGAEVIEYVRQRLGQIPTLMLTGSAEERVSGGGMENFLLLYKPIIPEYLTARIAQMVGRKAPALPKGE